MICSAHDKCENDIGRAAMYRRDVFFGTMMNRVDGDRNFCAIDVLFSNVSVNSTTEVVRAIFLDRCPKSPDFLFLTRCISIRSYIASFHCVTDLHRVWEHSQICALAGPNWYAGYRHPEATWVGWKNHQKRAACAICCT